VKAARARLGPSALIGASRHDAEGVAWAARDGATFALLSPVYEVPGKGPALGLDGFARIARVSALPVIALGGVSARNAAELIAAGAAGVAVIREVFDSVDPALATIRLLGALARPR
jgi:thiamine-phosphate pyrophosphorylase